MEAYRAGREYGLFWIVNGDIQGAFGWRSAGPYVVFGFEAPRGRPGNLYAGTVCNVVRAAARRSGFLRYGSSAFCIGNTINRNQTMARRACVPAGDAGTAFRRMAGSA